MSKSATKIGPADHGRRTSLEEFEQAEEQEGYLYELSRGIITVSDLPNRLHDEKPEEYLRFGVKEYWIVDPDRRLMVVLRRSRGRWVETSVAPPAVYRARLLPGLELSIADVFHSAGLS
jgi:hypothetical protein